MITPTKQDTLQLRNPNIHANPITHTTPTSQLHIAQAL